MLNAALRRVTLAMFGLALLAAAPRPAPSATAQAGAPSASTKDFRIETDQTNSNLNNGDFSMPHRVKFYRPGTDVVGDSAKGNFKSGTVTITGHVVLHDSGESAEAQKAGAAPGGGPAMLACDELQVDSKRKIYIAKGNVQYVQGSRHATAQNGKLDQGQHALDLSDNVRLADGDQTLTAQTVHYDTLTKDVSTSGSPVILSAPAPNGAGSAVRPAGSSVHPATGSSGHSASGSSVHPPTGSAGHPAAGAGTMSTLPTPAAKATAKPK